MPKPITETLEAIKDDTNGSKIALEDVVESMQRRGFGPLLMGPALLTVLPTGAIPGIPALCAVMIILIAVQIVAGRTHPWLPSRLKNFKFSRKKYSRALEKARPFTQWVDQHTHRRFEFFTKDPAPRLVAFISLLLAVAIIPIGFIPMVPALLAAPIVFFGVGLTAKDGLFTGIGFVSMGAGVAGVYYLIANSDISLP